MHYAFLRVGFASMCTNSLTTATFLLPFLTNEQHFLKQTKEARCVVAIKIILQIKTLVFIMHSHLTGLKMMKGFQLSKLSHVVDFFSSHGSHATC